MVMDQGTSHGLEQDSKFHGHVGGVEEDKGLRIVLNQMLKIKTGIK